MIPKVAAPKVRERKSKQTVSNASEAGDSGRNASGSSSATSSNQLMVLENAMQQACQQRMDERRMMRSKSKFDGIERAHKSSAWRLSRKTKKVEDSEEHAKAKTYSKKMKKYFESCTFGMRFTHDIPPQLVKQKHVDDSGTDVAAFMQQNAHITLDSIVHADTIVSRHVFVQCFVCDEPICSTSIPVCVHAGARTQTMHSHCYKSLTT